MSGIIIMGLNGCGKTTVGRELASMLNYRRIDVEDYYFPNNGESNVPYSASRTMEEVKRLILSDIKKYKNYVFSSVKCNWGEEITSTFKLAVILSAPLELRLERIKQREIARFGNRVLEGGDMYESQKEFHNIVASRSADEIKKQAELLSCPVLEIDAAMPLKEIVKAIYDFWQRVIASF